METRDLILDKARFEDWEDLYRNVWSRPETARYMLWIVTDSEEAAVVEAALTVEKVQKATAGMKIVKTIFVKNRLVNLIVKPS